MLKYLKTSRLIGFFILFAFVLMLLVTTLINLVTHNIPFFIVLLGFGFGSLYAVYFVFKEETYKHAKVVLDGASLKLFIAVLIGSLSTYLLHFLVGCPVLAAGIIGMFGAIFIKKYQVPIYTGAFVGMSSSIVFGFWPFMLAALLASLIFVLVQPLFNGYGGKLGTIALSGATISTLLVRGTFTEGTVYLFNEQIVIIVLSAAAAVLTYIISIRLRRGPVFSSAIVGIVAGVLLPLITRELGHTYAVVVIGASFVGMSSQVRFKDELPIFVGGILFGLIFIYSAPYFGGAGGKLGTIAFVSVLSVKGIMLMHEHLKLSKANC